MKAVANFVRTLVLGNGDKEKGRMISTLRICLEEPSLAGLL